MLFKIRPFHKYSISTHAKYVQTFSDSKNKMKESEIIELYESESSSTKNNQKQILLTGCGESSWTTLKCNISVNSE